MSGFGGARLVLKYRQTVGMSTNGNALVAWLTSVGVEASKKAQAEVRVEVGMLLICVCVYIFGPAKVASTST